MQLTPSRQVKLILFKILEYAEVGGMAPKDCGTAHEAISNCLDNASSPEQLETTMEGLKDQIQQILDSETWEQ